jgi:hypothetical protein
MRLDALICSYNHERYVARTIQSVLAQTRPADLVLVWDDGSTDQTVAVARRFEPAVRVVAQEHAGVVPARNAAVAATDGELVAIIDSDDLIEPDRFERQFPVFERDPAVGLCYGDCWLVDEAGRRLGRFWERYPPPAGGDRAAELFATYCFTPASTVTFRRAAFAATGPFWGPGSSTDYLKWVEMGLVSTLAQLPEPPLASWRRHASATSVGDARRQEALYLGLAEGLQRLWEAKPELRRRLPAARARRRQAMCHFMVAVHAIREGSWTLAAARFAAAARIAPDAPLPLAGWLASRRPVRPIAFRLLRLALTRRFRDW